MKIHLSEHFNYKTLLRFTLPSIVMMIFTSIYGVVDGLFVSNFVGKTSFAAVNLIYPFLMILGAFGFMFGTGGSALISKTMGEGDLPRARRLFSMLVCVSFSLGVLLAALGILFIRPIAMLLGAEGQMLEECVVYGRIILAALPFFMLQQEFQSFFITAEQPKLGLLASVAAGVTNMVFDALLVAVIDGGIVGAAIATALSQLVGGVIPLVYFARRTAHPLRLTRPAMDLGALLKSCTNGSSELMSNVSMSLVNMLYNVQLMRFVGEDGVAAYGVLMYVSFVFIAVFIGFSVGSAPVVGYHYGAENYEELRGLRRRCSVVIAILSVGMFLLGETLAVPLSHIFVGYDGALLALTVRGFRFFCFSFLFAGVAIFGSGFFTALNNGLVSALISFLRTLVFQVGAVLLLPLWLETDGIWLAIVVAELMAALLTAAFLLTLRRRYRY